MKKTETAKIQREILAKNLNELLEKKRQSQADVIKALNIPEVTVRSWFSGTKYPRILLLYNFFICIVNHIAKNSINITFTVFLPIST